MSSGQRKSELTVMIETIAVYFVAACFPPQNFFDELGREPDHDT